MKATLFFSGSFDPMTNGHLDIVRQSLKIADHMIIGVGVHSSKKGLFSFDERVSLIEKSLEDEDIKAHSYHITSFDNLVVEAARHHGAQAIVRGLRDGTDLDYEMQMAGMNGAMAPDIPTIFLPASPDTRMITATLVRQIALMGGDISPFVPEAVSLAFQERRAKSL